MMWVARSSGLTDNIPLAAVLAKVLSGFQSQIGDLTWFAEYGHLLWWGLIFGAGLGGNFTPIDMPPPWWQSGFLRKKAITSPSCNT